MDEVAMLCFCYFVGVNSNMIAGSYWYFCTHADFMYNGCIHVHEFSWLYAGVRWFTFMHEYKESSWW